MNQISMSTGFVFVRKALIDDLLIPGTHYYSSFVVSRDDDMGWLLVAAGCY